jgi:hypothetical protein
MHGRLTHFAANLSISGMRTAWLLPHGWIVSVAAFAMMPTSYGSINKSDGHLESFNMLKRLALSKYRSTQ